MNTQKNTLTIHGISIEIIRKNIKNMHLRVYPPDGCVRITVPLHIDNEAVRSAIIARIDWIKNQQNNYNQQSSYIYVHQYISGESHYIQGKPYLLNVIYHSTAPKIILRDNIIDLYVREGSDHTKRQAVLAAWYRQRLAVQIPLLIAKWQVLINVEVADWRIKHMKTRWGTCNTRDRRIWLALALAEKPLHCLEYVVVHEMTHLLERQHNERFHSYITRFLPNWREIRQELNQ